MRTIIPILKKKARMVKTLLPLTKGETVSVYFGTRVANALKEVTEDMELYKGVRLSQLFQAVYEQGKKDGAREVKNSFDHMMTGIPHKNPGQPKKKKKIR